MKKFILIAPFVLALCSGCTVSVIQTDTHGTATDVVDETASANPNFDTDIAPIK